MKTKKNFFGTIETIHLLIFGQKMSDRMRKFLANLSWSFFAGVISMPVFMVIVTLAGRFMGPAEFGKYNLVLLINSFAIVFAFFGLDISTIKRIAKAKTLAEKKASFASTATFVLLIYLCLCLIVLTLSQLVISKTNISIGVILTVLVFSFTVLLKILFEVLVRATEKFKMQATARLIEISTLIVFFIIVLVFFKMNYQLFLGISILSVGASLLYYLKSLKKYFGKFSLEILKSQLVEGKFFMLSAVIGIIFFSADKFLIARYWDVQTLGIYSAYYSASLGLVAGFSLIFTNVFLPAAFKADNKEFTKKLDKLLIKGFAPIYLLICFSIFIFLKIFGRAYPFNLSYLLLFAFAAGIYLYQIIYGMVVLDANRKDYIKYLFISSLSSLLTILYYLVVVKYLSKSIDLLLVGLSVNLAINLIISRFFLRKMRLEPRYNIETHL